MRAREDSMLVVAGCLTERYLDDLRNDMPEVDCWLPFKDYDRLSAMVRERFPDLPEHRLRHDQRSQLTPGHFAFLKIAEGCDNTCNFCAIPLFRGKHVSRPMEELVQQARTLAERGVLEINLISQHLDYYGKDLYGEYALPKLLREISPRRRMPGCACITATPTISATSSSPPWPHCPMCCPTSTCPSSTPPTACWRSWAAAPTAQQIEDRLGRIRAAMPDVVVRSTFIVGFPGEREQDMDELIDFLEQQRFDQIGCFQYSDEDDTTAAAMPKKSTPTSSKPATNALWKPKPRSSPTPYPSAGWIRN